MLEQPLNRYGRPLGGATTIGLSHIVKKFGENTGIKDVSVEIREGGLNALVGPLSGGKRMLLCCINLLEIPTSGIVRIGDDMLEFSTGHRVTTKAIQRLWLQAGGVFQNYQFFPHRTAVESFTEGLVTVPEWPEAKARERVLTLLEKGRHDAPGLCLAGNAIRRIEEARGDCAS